jgi:hypothetical protein
VPLDADVLGQVAYHVRCAAGLAAVGRSEECARHALLSWALLEAVGGDALRDAVGALDLPDDVGDVNGTAAGPVRRTTEELALQLCAHFTSEGRHRLAEVYQGAYQRLVSAG